MLTRTFTFLPGVGPRTEQTLWGHGITDWQTFVATPEIPGFSSARKRRYDALVGRACELLENGDWAAVVGEIPPRDRWRVYPHLRERTVCLDCEVDRLHRDSRATVVGLYDIGEQRCTQLVAHQDLNAPSLRRALEPYAAIITFNGGAFDLPFLESNFRPLPLPPVHFDLRHLAPRVGLDGGLKHVEYRLGIDRDPSIRFLRGREMTRFWRRWRRSRSLAALELLLRYNRADTEHLATIMDRVYDRLVDVDERPLRERRAATCGN